MNSLSSAQAAFNTGKKENDGMMVTGESMPASWGCSAETWYSIKIGCGSSNRDDCKKEFITGNNSDNESQLYMLRVVGILGAWAAVWCCFFPCIAFTSVLADSLNGVPCIGGCFELIGNIVETLVHIVVCCMSCSIGCSSALFVVAIVWVVMRPVMGICLLCFCALCVGGAIALLQYAPKKDGFQPEGDGTELS